MIAATGGAVNVQMSARDRCLLDDLDRQFGTIGPGDPCPVFESGRDMAGAADASAAEFIQLKQLGRQRMAACVPLAFLRIDPDDEPAISGHALRLTGFGETLLDIAFDVLKPDHRFLVHPRDLLGAGL